MSAEAAKERLIEGIASKTFESNKIVNHNINLEQWKITKLYKDCLWVKLLDEPDANTVMKNGLVLMTSHAKGVYSLGEILMTGDESKHAKVGDKVLFIKHVGQPAHCTVDGYKTHFVKEDAVMAIMEFNGTPEEMKTDIENQILLGDK
jgi:co-chaperonin GroES (HSP10)